MHSIEFIRKYPKEFDTALSRRGAAEASKEILALDKTRREIVGELQQLQQKRNETSAAIAQIKDKNQFAKLRDFVKEINSSIEAHNKKEKELNEALHESLISLPNILSNDVPSGNTDEANIVVLKHGTPREFNFAPKSHFELGEKLGQMDFVQAAKISGSRFVILKGALAQLEKALSRFMLDIHTKEFSFQEISPPLLVLPSAMYGAGQLPKFYEDAFQTTNGYWLIPTSEVCLVSMFNDSITPESNLPIRYAAATPNFRSEVGSAGKDTRGMIRQHQFYKVELATACTAEQYLFEYDHLMTAAQTVLERLELPFQKVLKCVGDTGFTAEKSYDFEVWFPAQNCYREISSCSICGQFQARRMKAKYRTSNSSTEYLFTMNGTGVAVGRALAAILENFQDEDGIVTLPKALHKYMDGQTSIAPLQ